VGELSEGTARRLARLIEELAVHLEKANVAEYVQLLLEPRRLLVLNFVAGLARGLGIAVGFTLLGALVVVLLQRVVMLNLPLIGSFIADIVRIVQMQLRP